MPTASASVLGIVSASPDNNPPPWPRSLPRTSKPFIFAARSACPDRSSYDADHLSAPIACLPEIVFLNFKLDGVSLCYKMRKSFDAWVRRFHGSII